jgi:hypothetical protein
MDWFRLNSHLAIAETPLLSFPRKREPRLGPRFRGDDDKGNVTVNRHAYFTSGTNLRQAAGKG